MLKIIVKYMLKMFIHLKSPNVRYTTLAIFESERYCL